MPMPADTIRSDAFINITLTFQRESLNGGL